MYVLLMADGTERELQHNIIAESMFSQADSEGRQYMLLAEITDHKRMKERRRDIDQRWNNQINEQERA